MTPRSTWLARTAASWPVTRIPAAAGERCRKWVAFTFTGQRSKLSSQLTERFCVSLCHSQCFVVWSETSSRCFVRAVVFMFGRCGITVVFSDCFYSVLRSLKYHTYHKKPMSIQEYRYKVLPSFKSVRLIKAVYFYTWMQLLILWYLSDNLKFWFILY